MGKFNYTQLHIFDKKGNELPLVYDTNFKIEIPNSSGDNAIFYGVLDPSNNISDFYCKYQGGKYDISAFSNIQRENDYILADVECIVNSQTGTARVKCLTVRNGSYYNSGESDLNKSFIPYYIDSIEDVVADFSQEDIKCPSVTFNTGVIFDKVSTDLVETQSLYVLFEENNEFKKISDIESQDVKDWSERYKLLFFIDCQKQKDFRFFNAESDEIVWTNKEIIDFTNDDFRIDIGFTTENEGIYEHNIIVCLIDTHDYDANGEQGVIYPIGTILMNAEAIGEDERYRTLFTNFGLPHPSEYMNVFHDTDLNEGKIDNINLNKNAKMLFLAYNDIFPYVGTYKALINAINLLGYDDVFFKEWYKIVGKEGNQGGYVNFDMSYHADLNANTINNLTIEERIHLRKLNWISMVYKINEELASKGEDRWGFPYTKKVHSYDDKESLIKLISLKEWLQKYIIGLNCRIIDIGGEGIYYERYRLDSYGSYQSIIEWNNVHNIAPYFENIENQDILQDSKAKISVNIGVADESTTLGDLEKTKIREFCEGYFDSNKVYHHMNTNVTDNDDYIYVGGTFGCNSHLDKYELRASSKIDNFLFGDEFIVDASVNDELYHGIRSSRLRIVDNELEFNTIDIFNDRTKTTIFKDCPIIQLEKANIRIFSNLWSKSIQYKIYPDLTNDTLSSYFIENEMTGEKQSTVDYITLVPPTYINEDDDKIILKPYGKENITVSKSTEYKVVSDYSSPDIVYNQTGATYGLKYSADNIYNIPFFSILGYQFDKVENNMPTDKEFILEILDGKMIFPDFENNRTIYLNFNFDTDSKVQTVEVNVVYNSDSFNPISYEVSNNESIKHFIEEKNYDTFIQKYTEDASTAINYNFIHDIDVVNAGEFTVDVIGTDSHNNIFAANCDGKASIKMPDINLTVYTNFNDGTIDPIGNIVNTENPMESEEDEEIVNVDKLYLKDSFIDFCLYKPNYLISGLTPKIDDENKTLKITYPSYSYSLHTPGSGEYVHFVNITDRYNIKAIDNIDSHTAANNEGVNTYEGYTLIAEANCPTRYNRVIEAMDYDTIAGLNKDVYPDFDENKTTVSNYLNRFYDSEYTFSDVNIVFYNELGGYPIAQTYANMANEHAFYQKDSLKDKYNNNDYRINVDDDSWRGYVWARIKDTEKQLLINHLGKFITNFIIDENWNIEQYLVPAETESEDEVLDDKVLDEDAEIEYEYLSIEFSNLDKVAKELSRKLYENFELGSINSTGNNYENNNDKLTSVRDVKYGSSYSPEVLHESYITYLNNAANNNIKDEINSKIEFKSNNSVNYKYIPYLIYNTEPNTNIVYPYTDNNNEQKTNILIDIASLLLDYNYDEIIEKECLKLFSDYNEKDSEETPKSVFDKISDEFLNTILVTNYAGNTQYEKLYNAITNNLSSQVRLLHNRMGIDSSSFAAYKTNVLREDINDEPVLSDSNADVNRFFLNWSNNVRYNDELGDIFEEDNDLDSTDDYHYIEEIQSGYYINDFDLGNINNTLEFKYIGATSKAFFNYLATYDSRRKFVYDKIIDHCGVTSGVSLNEINKYNCVHWLTAWDESKTHFETLSTFIKSYLNDDFTQQDTHLQLVILSLLEVLKGKKEINDKVYNQFASSFYAKLVENNELYKCCKEDNRLGSENQSVFSTVTNSNNFVSITPDDNSLLTLQAKAYVNGRGYKIITDSITDNNGIRLEINDYVKTSDGVYHKIGFIDELDNGTYSIKTTDKVYEFTEQEYKYPYNFVEISFDVYNNHKYDYIVSNETPNTVDHSFDDETLARTDEYGRYPYIYDTISEKLYKFVIEEHDIDDEFYKNILENGNYDSSLYNKIVYKNTNYTFTFSYDSIALNSSTYTDSNVDLYGKSDEIYIFSEDFIDKTEELNDWHNSTIPVQGQTQMDEPVGSFILPNSVRFALFERASSDTNAPFNNAYTDTIFYTNDSTQEFGVFIYGNKGVGASVNYNNAKYIINYFIIHVDENNHYKFLHYSQQEQDGIVYDDNDTLLYINAYQVVRGNVNKPNYNYITFPALNNLKGKFNSSSTPYSKLLSNFDNLINGNKEFLRSISIIRFEETHHWFPSNATVQNDIKLYAASCRWEEVTDIPAEVDLENDRNRELTYTVMETDIDDETIVENEHTLIIYTRDNISSVSSANHTAKAYCNGHGYTLSIPVDEFVSDIHPFDVIQATSPNSDQVNNNPLKVLYVKKDEDSNEYKLILDNKIYSFSDEELKELYISHDLELEAYKMKSTQASINVIRTNLLCLFTLCLYNMKDITSGREDDINYNIKQYFALLYIYYTWIGIKLIHNIKEVVDTYLPVNPALTNSVESSNAYINRYMFLVDPYLQSYAYPMLYAYKEAVYNYFYAEDSSMGMFLRTELIDEDYHSDMISIYDKLLTSSSQYAIEMLKEANWVTMGDIHVQDILGTEGLYAVGTHKNPNELKKEDTYEKQLETVDYETVTTKNSVSISTQTKKSNNNILDSSIIEDSSIYYVKTFGFLKSGYSTVTKDLPENAVTSIKDMLNSSYISTYIKPTWKAAIKADVLDPKIVKNSPLDPAYDYIYVTFISNIFKTTFKIGEKVKIIFESAVNDSYIGQSAFEVVAYDLTSNAIILRGSINEEYLNAKQMEVWHRLYTQKNEDGSYTILQQVYPHYVKYEDEDGKEQYDIIVSENDQFDSSTDVIIDKNETGMPIFFITTDKNISVNSSYYTMEDIKIPAYDENGKLKRTERGELITNTITISIPIKYESADNRYNVNDASTFDSSISNENIEQEELEDGSNVSETENIIWYHRAYTILPNGKTIMPINVHASTSEQVNMYISYAHHSYVDYQMKVVDAVEHDDGTTEISIEYNNTNRRLFDFIDDTFSLTAREFNIGEGMGAWMNSTRNTIKLNDSLPDIVDGKEVYRYENHSPELTQDNNLIAFDINLKNTGINEESYTNYWKVYRKSPITNEDELLFESFNPVLYLDYTDKGIYSIESFVFDKYGNMASKLYKGAYKIK